MRTEQKRLRDGITYQLSLGKLDGFHIGIVGVDTLNRIVVHCRRLKTKVDQIDEKNCTYVD